MSIRSIRRAGRTRRGAPRTVRTRTNATLIAALFVFVFACVFLAAAPARSQVRPPVLNDGRERQRPRRVEAPTPFGEAARGEREVGREEDESGSGGDEEERRPRAADPATAMRQAKFVHVRSLSAFVSDREVEDSLRKRKEVIAWGLIITRSEAEADLVIEITRKAFSRRYTFTVLDPRTMLVVTSGKTRSVLFGKNIANKIAEKFANRLRAVRPYPPQTP